MPAAMFIYCVRKALAGDLRLNDPSVRLSLTLIMIIFLKPTLIETNPNENKSQDEWALADVATLLEIVSRALRFALQLHLSFLEMGYVRR